MYKVVKEFKGSPDGHTVILFKEGDDFTEKGDLLKVALEQGWIVEDNTAEAEAAAKAQAEAEAQKTDAPAKAKSK